MEKARPPSKSLVEQILEETLSGIQTSGLFSVTEMESLKKLAHEGGLNKESIIATLNAAPCEEPSESSGT